MRLHRQVMGLAAAALPGVIALLPACAGRVCWQKTERPSAGAQGLQAVESVSVASSPALGHADPEERIVVALQDIAPGTPLRTSMLAVVPRPADVAWAGHLRPVDLVHFAGVKIRRPIAKGQPVRRDDLDIAGLAAVPGKGTALPFRVPPGLRPVTVRVDLVGAAGFWVRAGDRVDVVLVSARGQPPEPTVQTLMQGAVVVAASEEAGEGAARERSCTLLALPQEANALALAQQVGRILLFPRGAGDDRPAAYPPVTRKDLESPAFWERWRRERGQRLPETEAPDDPGIRAK